MSFFRASDLDLSSLERQQKKIKIDCTTIANYAEQRIEEGRMSCVRFVADVQVVHVNVNFGSARVITVDYSGITGRYVALIEFKSR